MSIILLNWIAMAVSAYATSKTEGWRSLMNFGCFLLNMVWILIYYKLV
jgi:hypothetical protein